MLMITTDMRWDESAKRVMKLCRKCAADFAGNFIGTESLLLALVSETPIEEHGIELLHFEAVATVVPQFFTPREVLAWGCPTLRYERALEAAAKRPTAESRPISRRDLWRGLMAESG